MAKHFMQFEHNQSNYFVPRKRCHILKKEGKKAINTFHMYIFRNEMNIVPDSKGEKKPHHFASVTSKWNWIFWIYMIRIDSFIVQLEDLLCILNEFFFAIVQRKRFENMLCVDGCAFLSLPPWRLKSIISYLCQKLCKHQIVIWFYSRKKIYHSLLWCNFPVAFMYLVISFVHILRTPLFFTIFTFASIAFFMPHYPTQYLHESESKNSFQQIYGKRNKIQ